MIAKMKRKTVIFIMFSVIAIAISAVFAVPAIAAESSQVRIEANKIITVQGTILTLSSSTITIKLKENPKNQVILALTDRTNFSIRGISWLNPASLIGNNVTAVYENNQKATPPIASQITINMPAPVMPVIQAPVPIPVLPPVRSFATVQGSLKVNLEGTIMISPPRGEVVGPLRVTENTSVSLYGAVLSRTDSKINASVILTGNSTVNYNSKTKEANQVMINVQPPSVLPKDPAPVPGLSSSKSIRSIMTVQGTLTVNPNGTITVTPTKGDVVGPLTLDSGTKIEVHGAALSQSGSKVTASITSRGTVSVTYNTQTKVAIQISFLMPPQPVLKLPATTSNTMPSLPLRDVKPNTNNSTIKK